LVADPPYLDVASRSPLPENDARDLLTDRLRAAAFQAGSPGYLRALERGDREEVKSVLALILLALLAIVLLGVGFTIHWLFIIAAIAALLWLIAAFTGGLRGRRRGYWY